MTRNAIAYWLLMAFLIGWYACMLCRPLPDPAGDRWRAHDWSAQPNVAMDAMWRRVRRGTER